MEKRGILCIVLIFSFLISNAQDAFIKKDLLISGSLYLINYRKHLYDFSERAGKSVPLSFSAEYGLTQYVSAGVFAGYYLKRYRYTANTTEPSDDIFFSSRFMVQGIKASLHLTSLLEKKFDVDFYSEDLDLYVSGLLGYEWNHISRNDVPAEGDSRFVPGFVLGARYYLTQRWAVFGEIGPGIFGIGNIGMTARF
jgi:hypothetical protein